LKGKEKMTNAEKLLDAAEELVNLQNVLVVLGTAKGKKNGIYLNVHKDIDGNDFCEVNLYGNQILPVVAILRRRKEELEKQLKL
jgi:alcohol dehydrogenase YqhD (iron-dependent ADH family)